MADRAIAAPRRAPEKCRDGRRRTADRLPPSTARCRAPPSARRSPPPRPARTDGRGRARPPPRAAAASSARCFGRDRPACAKNRIAGREQRLGVSGSTRAVEAGRRSHRRWRANLLRDDDRGEAGKARLATAGAAPRRPAARTAARRGSSSARAPPGLPCDVVQVPNPAASAPLFRCEPGNSSNRQQVPHNPISWPSHEPADLPLRAEPERRAASRPCLFRAAQPAAGAARRTARLLLRMEDIDTVRCTPEFEAGICRRPRLAGHRLGRPVRRQSEHFADYAEALRPAEPRRAGLPGLHEPRRDPQLIAEQEAAGRPWPRDPDGVPLYPGFDRALPQTRAALRMASGEPFAWRLDCQAALAAARRPAELRPSCRGRDAVGVAPGRRRCAPAVGRRHARPQGRADELSSGRRRRRCAAGRQPCRARPRPVRRHRRAAAPAGSAWLARSRSTFTTG